ncbi:MAG: tRNA 2-thiouridine(34) synthase MnmA [Oscillospiraceae bacterium]|nr:tRNA 2-thiouridine(34) synthase MnmA [Oscillospiraceae bacterium]
MKTALIAMSGGVDSSIAAYLTQQAGYSCIGCTMKLYENADANIPRENTCCSLDDIEDARSVAFRLDMPYYVFQMTDLFREKVIRKFCDAYCAGRTPNPCIDCNRYLKFEALLARADALHCDKIVTGHYARIEETDRGYLLKKAADPAKDQSYVLYMLTQAQLARILFPLGGLQKQQVRALAEAQGFVNAHKHDSQDICFVPDGDYARVIETQTGITPEPGDFVDLQGNVIGRHDGLIHYTVGQRRGLGIAIGKPAYVCGLDVPGNRVVIGENADLFRRACIVTGINWISGEPPQEPVRCEAKIRYRHPGQPALLEFTDSDTARLTFDAPQRAITAGQAAVFYDGDTVLGGGEILRTENE